ncbi:uncharacterized protein LOC117176408 [Belonocnema kinseyi]|uniref:uncharacterized protein LOC117176408 n=1 Tax=Belonocnema kinseyi TaxID=2817044 RepID=UPI00143D5F1E|nr:uncharacterized protein LOC117176408 [Belonocnema kinseyi]
MTLKYQKGILNCLIGQIYANCSNLKKRLKETFDSMHRLLPANIVEECRNRVKSVDASSLVKIDKNNARFTNLICQQGNVQQLYLNLHSHLYLELKDPWLINISGIRVSPDSVLDILRLGGGFSNEFGEKKSDQVINMVKCLENNMEKIDDLEDRRNVRRKFLILSVELIRKNRSTTVLSNKLSRGLALTREFLSNNAEILITKADKGNITVLINRDSNNEKIEAIFCDKNSFMLVERDPLKTSQKATFLLLKRWRDKKYLGKKADVGTVNINSTNLALAYSLVKIHKEGFPLRPVISTVNKPTRKLEEFILSILKKSIDAPRFSIKNSLEFISKIPDFQVPSDSVFVSFDVVAMYPNIPMTKVLVVSPIFADMVMEDIELEVLKSFSAIIIMMYHSMFITLMTLLFILIEIKFNKF